MVVRELMIRMGFDVEAHKLERVGRAIEEIKREGRQGAREVGGLGAALKRGLLGLGITAGLAAIAREGVTTIATFQRLEAQLITIEGSAEKAASAFQMLQDFARSTPFELENIVASFSRLRAVGLAPTTQDLTNFGDIAAGMGGDILDFSEAVVAATTGEMERLKQFGIVARQQGKQVTFTFKGKKTTIRRDSKEIFRFLSDLGKANFAGGMTRQMNTIGGATSNLKDNISAFFNAVGEAGLAEALTKFIQQLTGIVGEGDGAAETLGRTLAAALRVLTEALRLAQKNAGAVKAILVLLGSGAVLMGLGKVATAIGGITKATLALRLATLRAAAAQALLGAKVLLAGAMFGLILLAVEDLFGFFEGKDSVIGRFLEEMGYTGEAAVNRLKEALYGVALALGIVLTVLNPPLGLIMILITLVAYLWQNAEKIGPAFENMGSQIYDFFAKLLTLIALEIASWFTDLGTAIGEWAAGAWVPIEDALLDTIAMLEQGWSEFVEWFFASIDRVVGAAARAAESFSSPIELGKRLAAGELSVDGVTSAIFGPGSSGPGVDAQRRAAQVRNTRTNAFRIDSPITITQTPGAGFGETALELEREIRATLKRAMGDAASDLEGGLD